ncbi:MAG: phosphate ABC transporter, permease protein PstA, partial [Gammaproteobacteria bacterium]|nr:phosphate ABC transporter, permease protein PstA [Gammaproteobacteria bacterium]
MRLSRYQTERIAFAAIGVATLLTVAPIIIVVGAIFISGSEAISWEFLVEMPRDGMRAGGIWPAIVGTAYLALGTGIISVPLGLGAAIYLSEYARESGWTRAIRVAIVNLAGIPSVVYGLFGLGLFVLFLRLGSSIVAACLTLSIMTLPVII